MVIAVDGIVVSNPSPKKTTSPRDSDGRSRAHLSGNRPGARRLLRPWPATNSFSSRSRASRRRTWSKSPQAVRPGRCSRRHGLLEGRRRDTGPVNQFDFLGSMVETIPEYRMGMASTDFHNPNRPFLGARDFLDQSLDLRDQGLRFPGSRNSSRYFMRGPWSLPGHDPWPGVYAPDPTKCDKSGHGIPGFDGCSGRNGQAMINRRSVAMAPPARP